MSLVTFHPEYRRVRSGEHEVYVNGRPVGFVRKEQDSRRWRPLSLAGRPHERAFHNRKQAAYNLLQR